MSNDDVIVWDTEDAACVYGTHDVAIAQRRYERYLRDDAGMNDTDIAEYGASLEEWSSASPMWADPRSLELEDVVWPEEMYGPEAKDGWVPYLWLVR